MVILTAPSPHRHTCSNRDISALLRPLAVIDTLVTCLLTAIHTYTLFCLDSVHSWKWILAESGLNPYLSNLNSVQCSP